MTNDMQQITWEGDVWNIVSLGAIDHETKSIWVHLSSTTRFRQQRNGKCPIQMLDQIPFEDLPK